jgi:hypothetical protein
LLERSRLEVKNIKDIGVKKWRRWRKLRRAIVDHYKCCAICGWKKKLEGHHVKPRHLYPELTLIWENVVILCRDCHFHIAHWNNYKDYNPEIETIANMTTIIRLKEKRL